MLSTKQLEGGFCWDLRARLANKTCLTQKCRDSIGGRKVRLMSQATKKFGHELHIDNLLKQIRVFRGIIKERFELDNDAWDRAMQKYGPIYLNQLSSSGEEESKSVGDGFDAFDSSVKDTKLQDFDYQLEVVDNNSPLPNE